MRSLREQLERCTRGRVCLVGLGNVEHGDDAFGVRLVEAVRAWFRGRGTMPTGSDTANRGAERREPGFGSDAEMTALSSTRCLLVAGTNPERYLGRVFQQGFDHLVFLDAVEFGGQPGSAVLLDSNQMAARFPQISTHQVSLGVLAKWIEANGTTRAWLLGVQPESLRPGAPLSPAVERTSAALAALLGEALANPGVGIPLACPKPAAEMCSPC